MSDDRLNEAATVDFAMQFESGCRDCADAHGTCPSSGMPCDPDTRRATVAHTVRAINYGLANAYLDRSSSNEAVAVKADVLGDENDLHSVAHALDIGGIGTPYRAYQGSLYCDYQPHRIADFQDYGLALAATVLFNNAKAIKAALAPSRIRSALEPSPAQPSLLSEAEWQLRAELRSDWEHFCQCDWHLMQGDTATFDQRMEAAGFIDLVHVTDSALEMPFASELGIEKGGMMWQLTPLGSSIVKTSKGAPNV
jgi:hypothetical protein